MPANAQPPKRIRRILADRAADAEYGTWLTDFEADPVWGRLTTRFGTVEQPLVQLAATLAYQDRDGRIFYAEPGTVSNGSSIPPPLEWLTGDGQSDILLVAGHLHDQWPNEAIVLLPGAHHSPSVIPMAIQEGARLYRDMLVAGGYDLQLANTMQQALHMFQPAFRWLLGGAKWEIIPCPSDKPCDRQSISYSLASLAAS